MIINELLIEKYNTQKMLDSIAGHDIVKYASDTHNRVKELSDRFGFRLRYGIPHKEQQRKRIRKVRNALKRCKGSMSEDILSEREDRI